MRGTAAVLALSLPIAMAGCGDNDSASAPTPQGFRKAQMADFSLAVPSAWQVDRGREDGADGEFVEARPPGTDLNRAQLRVGSARDYKGDINHAVLLAQAEIPVRRPGATRVVNKAIDVPGAQDGRRIEWTVPAGGGIEAARIVTVLALSADRTLVNLSIGVAQSQVAGTRIEDLVRSLRVGRG